MSFLKALSFGKLSRHKKLPEEWGSAIKQPVADGMNFYVKYLGSTLVVKASDEATTAEAIKSIIAMAKISGKKLKRVTLTVKPSGLQVLDVSTGHIDIDVSIYRISYCSADATFERVVAFIATNKNETLECHAFLTSKRKIAQAAALTISQAFTIAFEKWQETKNNSKNHKLQDSSNCEPALIDLSFDTSSSKLDNGSKNGFENSSKNGFEISSKNGFENGSKNGFEDSSKNGFSSSVVVPKLTSSLESKKENGFNQVSKKATFKERFDEDEDQDEDLDASFFALAKSRASFEASSDQSIKSGNDQKNLLPSNVLSSDLNLDEFMTSCDFSKDDKFFNSDSPDDLFSL